MIESMKLCTARGISSVTSIQPKLLAPNQIQPVHCNNQFHFVLKQTRFNSGLRCRTNLSLRSSTTSEETGRTPYDVDEPEADGEINVETIDLGEKKEDYETQPNEAPQEGSLVDNLQFLKFLEEFDIKFDYEDTSSILVFGGGGAVALWLAAAVVGAIDSIPLVPKVLELVGLGYTVWFSSRYLIFKKNRDELIATVEQIKQQVLGSKDN
ncbi:protein CURVATURE THYLAKOID 1D, chloroplastic-like isoform X2 [Salvia miltiorrhiza]|uniref:protein CURVATURE THYLAKOID 1D, chloroplastic-like isoform X2 n=1 Tax=Salvia miltiorrhiza TaxID=226208 RepID=UPI0025AB8958|nr:protein CURVATURE THYLAKOID 1D, chloroplastic-like isoform X2 [Salvia miltiorrhiza]